MLSCLHILCFSFMHILFPGLLCVGVCVCVKFCCSCVWEGRVLFGVFRCCFIICVFCITWYSNFRHSCFQLHLLHICSFQFLNCLMMFDGNENEMKMKMDYHIRAFKLSVINTFHNKPTKCRAVCCAGLIS